MIFQEILLFKTFHIRHWFKLFEMRPAIFIFSFQLVVTALRKQAANGNMHEVLLLFLGELIPELSKFLYAYQEKDGFHIGFFTKPFHQPGFKVPPALLQIIFCKHLNKDKKWKMENGKWGGLVASS